VGVAIILSGRGSHAKWAWQLW